MARTKKQSIHYVDNKQFLAAMIDYKQACKQCEEQGQESPPLPDYIGECFMKIAERLSFRPNFVNYAFREEMIADGIENCVQYAYNFDTDKSKNPFSYFTQIIYFAFVRRIQKEKKQLYIKYKTIQDQSLLSDNVDISEHDSRSFNYETLTEEQKANMYDFMHSFETSKKKKVKKATTNSLAAFITDEQ